MDEVVRVASNDTLSALLLAEIILEREIALTVPLEAMRLELLSKPREDAFVEPTVLPTEAIRTSVNGKESLSALGLVLGFVFKLLRPLVVLNTSEWIDPMLAMLVGDFDDVSTILGIGDSLCKAVVESSTSGLLETLTSTTLDGKDLSTALLGKFFSTLVDMFCKNEF